MQGDFREKERGVDPVTPTNAVVTASYEPRVAFLGIWGDTWLTRGKYGINVAVRGSYRVYVTPSAT